MVVVVVVVVIVGSCFDTPGLWLIIWPCLLFGRIEGLVYVYLIEGMSESELGQ